MRFFLTGSTGFIGARFLRLLVRQGHETTVLLRPDSNTWRIDDLLGAVTVVRGDLSDRDDLCSQLVDAGVDCFCHFSWKGVAGRDRNDDDQLNENLPRFSDALELAKLLGAGTFVSLGSQSEYGKATGLISEEHPAAPETLYAQAKDKAHSMAESFCGDAEMRLLWFRVFPLYGPGETEPWLIPSLVHHLLKEEPYAMTACEQVRDYLYVDDAAEGILKAIESSAEGVFNLSSGVGTPLCRIVELVRDYCRPGAPLQLGELPYRGDQSMSIIGDSSKLQKATGWSPKVDLEKGLRETVQSLVDEFRSQ